MGVSVVNAGSNSHWQPATGLFEMKLNRHQDSLSVDAWTTPCSQSQWKSIVDSAKSNDTDSQFVDVLYSVWPSWTQDHVIIPSLGSVYRTMILKMVNP